MPGFFGLFMETNRLIKHIVNYKKVLQITCIDFVRLGDTKLTEVGR
ncbi:hypothetical protein GCM10011409_30600 [Lentibacillus populi]|uniref:Uncharacterized protein n=1 Tax=Lentibacillus populi TaxID=1827502 RepID=A0A9W5X6A5_9BACI|nr:hypothetical protein GCM10011409_30600 [Lentibacillus populi]